MAFALLVLAPAAQGETADERDLRDHAAGNDLPAVQSLLAKGTSPNVPDHSGRTAVHHAAAIAKAAILEALLEAGGDPDVPDASGATPLHLAADFPYFEPDSQLSVRVLLHYGAEPGLADSEGRTPLHLVAGNHEGAAAVRDLLSSGADANAVDTRGDTPLHHAIGRSGRFSIDVVAALVDGGARADAVGGSGETPLQLFARVGTDDGRIVDALLAGGADPDAKNPDGETPLHTAVRSGGGSENPEIVAALLAAGADPCIADVAGYIPYNTAREGGRVHAMLADVDGYDRACDGRGATAEPIAAGPPGQLCSASGEEDGCWLAVADRDGCYVWKHNPRREESVTWSGDCQDGRASGSGTEVRTFLSRSYGRVTDSHDGTYEDGLRNGHWVEHFEYTGSGVIEEGPYVDGMRNGHWVEDWDGGALVQEGPYVDNLRNGHWVMRHANGVSEEGTYVDGRKHGQWTMGCWVKDFSDGELLDINTDAC